MVSVVRKWKINIQFLLPKIAIEFYIHEDHYTNMLAKLQNISFGLDIPVTIHIELMSKL